MEEDEKDMNNYGGVGASDAAVLALLADTSRAGRGGGYGGGYGEGGYGGYGHGTFANFSSNAVRSNAVGEQVVRNGQDAHFFALSGQASNNFTHVDDQIHATQLATQAQISQLALQFCECCGDNKAALGRIEGRLDCMEKSVINEINLCINNQTIADLRAKIGELQGNGNGNGWPYVTAPPTVRTNGVAT